MDSDPCSNFGLDKAKVQPACTEVIA
jgi:hypothetical protein